MNTRLLLLVAASCLVAAVSGAPRDKKKGGKMKDLKMLLNPKYPWFHARSSEDDCGAIPTDDGVKFGHPVEDACRFAEPNEEVCVCAKKPKLMLYVLELMGLPISEVLNPDTGFARFCGKCKDPCAAKWVPAGHDGDDPDLFGKFMKMIAMIAVKGAGGSDSGLPPLPPLAGMMMDDDDM